jgi:hypothetical protein
MLTVLGPRNRFCDRVSRRSFLQVGGWALGGLSLAGLMRAEAAAGRRSHKSVIVVYLSGGLAHQDTFDLKPNAPAEVRGEFNPIPTSVPGLQVGELLPRLARCIDRVAVLRSIVGLADEHSSWQNLCGAGMGVSRREMRPHFGSVVARLQGAVDPLVPPFVDLFPTMQHKPYNSPPAGRLGRAAAGVKVDGDEVAVMRNLAVPADRLEDRRGLLHTMDTAWRAADAAGPGDTFHQKAFEVLTSSKLVEALDVTKEPDGVRDRYGRGSPRHLGDGAPMWNDQLLMARRLRLRPRSIQGHRQPCRTRRSRVPARIADDIRRSRRRARRSRSRSSRRAM